MSLSAKQADMLSSLRSAVATNNPALPNPSNGEMYALFAQLFIDAGSASPLSVAKQAAMATALRITMTRNVPGTAPITDADVTAFMAQMQTDSSGMTVLSSARYLAFLNALRGALSSNTPGVGNPSITDLWGYLSAGATSTPLSIMGANCMARFRGDSGLTSTTWADQTSNHNDIAGTGTVVASALGGISGIQCVAASTNGFQKAIALPQPATTPTVFWAIIRADSWINGGIVVSGFSTNATPGMSIIQGGSTPQVLQNGGVGYGPANAALVVGTFKRVEIGFTGSTADYVKVGSTVVTGVNTGNLAGNQIALFQGWSSRGDGTCVEFCWFNSIPTAGGGGQTAQLDAYASGLYGAGVLA